MGSSDSNAPTPVSEKQLGGKLAGLSLPRQVLVLAIWPLLEQIMALAVGTVDLALAGHLQPEEVTLAATDALGVAGFIGWLMFVIYGAVGTGAAALIARAVGGSKQSLARAGLGQAITLIAVIGVVTGATVYLLADALAGLVQLEGRAAEYCADYLRIISLAAPASALMGVTNACLRAAGDTRTPFVVMVVVNITNVAFSVLFVYGPEPIGGHGVLGIAMGTFTAWIVGALIILAVIMRPKAVLQLRLRRLRPHWHTMRRIVRVGVPSLAETLGGTWFATFLVLLIVGVIQERTGGNGLIGAHMIAVRVEAFSFLPAFAMGIAASTLCGQYLGLGDPVRARKAVVYCWAMASLPMGLFGIWFFTYPQPLIWIMTKAPTMVETAIPLVKICGLIQLSFAAYLVLAMALRGAGDTQTTMKITYLSVFTIRVPLAFVLGLGIPGTGFDGFGIIGVWVALCLDLFSRGSLFTARFLHGGWQKVEV